LYIPPNASNGSPSYSDFHFYGIQLNRGVHKIYVKLRGKVAANVMCDIQIKSTPFEVLTPHFLPDVVDGHIFSKHMTYKHSMDE
jgi:hypothetical protein